MLRTVMNVRAVCVGVLVAVAGVCGAHAVPGRVVHPADPGATDNDKIYVHTAVKGDTLGRLAERYLVDRRDWALLQKLNSVADPNRLPIGKAIRIPVQAMRAESAPPTVLAVHGDVRVENRGAPATGQKLGEKDRLMTGDGGFVTIRLADGSTVTVQPQSAVELARVRQLANTGGIGDTVLKVEAGRLETQVARQSPAARYEVRTPTSNMGVRGTVFRVGSDASGARAQSEVIEGAVGVRSSAAAQALQLDAGYGTLVETGKPPLPPVKLLPAPNLDAVPAIQAAAMLRVAVPPVAGARAYRAQAALDRGFTRLLAEIVSMGTDIRLAGVPAGEAFLRVRAIDRLGLEGEDAVKPIKVVSPLAPPLLSSPAAEAVLAAAPDFSWLAVPEAAGYRLQIAADDTFARPLVESDSAVPRRMLDRDLPPGRYFWRVAAVRGDAQTGTYSTARGLSIAPAVLTVRPEVAFSEATFRWKAEPGRTYRFQLALRESFREPIVDRLVSAGEVKLDRLPKNTYFFRVRLEDAQNPASAGPWSEVNAVEVFGGVF